MDPLNDEELDDVLRQWQAHPSPASLTSKLLRARRRPVWRWLLAGSIRVPVPFALAFGVLLIAVFLTVTHPAHPRVRSEFQPVKRLEPHIIKSSYENDN
jgi:hypothetical protein